MIVVAHRGNCDDSVVPENTLTAFAQAWASGAHGAELDIHLTADGHIVVIHDATTGKLADIDLIVGRSELQTLQAIPLHSRKSRDCPAERIPTLAEVLAQAPHDRLLYIEIKSGAAIIPPLVKELTASGRTPENTVLMGFAHLPLQALKATFPGFPVYVLYTGMPGSLPVLSKLIKQVRDWGVDGVNIESCPHFTPDFCAELKEHRLSLHTYLTGAYERNSAMLQHIIDAGVDSITSDRPIWVQSVIDGTLQPGDGRSDDFPELSS
jgi:glycerophosphoryl diester phosphodiesterase